MNRSNKCEEILKNIIEQANKGHWTLDEEYWVRFMSDIGRNNSVCIEYNLEDKGPSHIHFGGFSSSWNELVDEMHKFFTRIDENNVIS